MRIHDLLPTFARFVEATEHLISPGAEGPAAAHGRETDIVAAFRRHYLEPNEGLLGPVIEDMASWTSPLTEAVTGLNAARARRAIETAARRGYPQRAERTLRAVEAFFGRVLPGDLVLAAALGRIDGYARFDHGRHVVYIGIDYPEPADHYLDLITAHELGHVVREGNAATWSALGLPADMGHDDFTERCPFEEHMIGEGLSTALSEAIFPLHELHDYLYFRPEQAEWCRAHVQEIAAGLERFRGTCEAHYGLYARDAIAPGSPERTQYFWGFTVVRRALERVRDLRTLFEMPAREILALGGA